MVQEDDGYEEAVREHNVFGIWLDKDGVPNTQQPETRICFKTLEVWTIKRLQSRLKYSKMLGIPKTAGASRLCILYTIYIYIWYVIYTLIFHSFPFLYRAAVPSKRKLEAHGVDEGFPLLLYCLPWLSVEFGPQLTWGKSRGLSHFFPSWICHAHHKNVEGIPHQGCLESRDFLFVAAEMWSEDHWMITWRCSLNVPKFSWLMAVSSLESFTHLGTVTWAAVPLQGFWAKGSACGIPSESVLRFP